MTGVLVHEWIAQDGGSENVFQALSEVFPNAPLVCLWNDSTGRFDPDRLQESWLARTPLRRSKALSLPLTTVAWRMLRDRGYDWALISSHAFAHHAKFRGAGPDFKRLVYVHTPARYVWTPGLDARGDRLSARAVSGVLQPLDRRRAREGARFAANSHYVRERIEKVWDVPARVIYPPVEVERIQSIPDWTDALSPGDADVLDKMPDGFLMGASRFIPYKRLDEVIAVGEATGRPVVLAGRGPSRAALEERARTATVPVLFVDSPSDALLYALYQRTAAYVFPAVEDFGIMPVEAMAAGAAVVARNEGGAAESVVHGVTGALTDFSGPEQMLAAVDVALATDRKDRLARATEFGSQRFQLQIRDWVRTDAESNH